MSLNTIQWRAAKTCFGEFGQASWYVGSILSQKQKIDSIPLEVNTHHVHCWLKQIKVLIVPAGWVGELVTLLFIYPSHTTLNFYLLLFSGSFTHLPPSYSSCWEASFSPLLMCLFSNLLEIVSPFFLYKLCIFLACKINWI